MKDPTDPVTFLSGHLEMLRGINCPFPYWLEPYSGSEAWMCGVWVMCFMCVVCELCIWCVCVVYCVYCMRGGCGVFCVCVVCVDRAEQGHHLA